jgi:hypothetical protein
VLATWDRTVRFTVEKHAVNAGLAHFVVTCWIDEELEIDIHIATTFAHRAYVCNRHRSSDILFFTSFSFIVLALTIFPFAIAQSRIPRRSAWLSGARHVEMAEVK